MFKIAIERREGPLRIEHLAWESQRALHVFRGDREHYKVDTAKLKESPSSTIAYVIRRPVVNGGPLLERRVEARQIDAAREN